MDSLIREAYIYWMKYSKIGSDINAELIIRKRKANIWKERYRNLVMQKRIKKHNQFFEALKQYPMLNLN